MISFVLANAAVHAGSSGDGNGLLFIVVIGVLLVGFAGLASAVAGLVLASRLGTAAHEDIAKKNSNFARTLRADVKEHSNTIGELFFNLLRTTPDSMETLRAHLRNLRNELSGPVNYIDRMNAYPVAGFPTDALSSAYGKWSGEVRALQKTVDDLHHELIYPLVNEPVVKRREDYLLKQYQIDAEVLLRGVNAVKDAAKKLDALAAPLIKEEKKPAEKPL